MNNRFLFPVICILLVSLASCSGRKIFWDVDEGRDQPAYAGNTASAGTTEKRAPLDVPPELRAELELPGAEDVAASNDPNLPDKYRKTVAGKAVSLSARVYDADAAKLFSAVVDAMTALNLPVDSVDSPSGIVTSDWIRKGANNANVFGGIFGVANGPKMTKHRFVVRVFRLKVGGQPKSKLEIRVLGQVYDNGHWVNKSFKQDVSKELFAAVEEQLARMQPETPAGTVKPAANPCSIQQEKAEPSASPEDAALKAVEAWRAAWSSKDVQGYFAAYAPEFRPKKGSFAAWSRHKQRVIEKKTYIDVKLEGVKVEPVSEDTMNITFVQHFVSNNYSSDDRKLLTLKKQPDGWKIIRETTL